MIEVAARGAAVPRSARVSSMGVFDLDLDPRPAYLAGGGRLGSDLTPINQPIGRRRAERAIQPAHVRVCNEKP